MSDKNTRAYNCINLISIVCTAVLFGVVWIADSQNSPANQSNSQWWHAVIFYVIMNSMLIWSYAMSRWIDRQIQE